MTSQPACSRCGTPLKVVEVRVPVHTKEIVDLDAHHTRVLPVTRYERREELADCPRCTGGY